MRSLCCEIMAGGAILRTSRERERHGRAQRVIAPGDRPSTPPWGWRRKTWMPGRDDAIRAPGHDDWNRSA
jgi:hypothetical protein